MNAVTISASATFVDEGGITFFSPVSSPSSYPVFSVAFTGDQGSRVLSFAHHFLLTG
jgi:hypothetical protein